MNSAWPEKPTSATAGSSRALLTPEELIQAASRKHQQQQNKNQRNDILSIMVDVESKSVSSNGEIIIRSASVNPTKTHNEATASIDHNNVDSSSAIIPGPPRLQRNKLHVQPGAYRIHRGQSMVVSASNNHKRTPEMDDDNGCRESRRDPADTITTTITSSRNGPNDCSFTSTSSSASTITYTHQEEEEENHPNDRDRSTVVLPLEAELVEVVDQQVVKAEPMPNQEPHNNRRGACLIFFISYFLILTSAVSLLLYLLLQPKNMVLPDFPYYTHHTVLFVSADAAFKEFEIILTCGNGAVATKNVNGPCDQRDVQDGDSILCRLGHILGNYNRPIFFSCGSTTIVEEPSVTISASADSGTGLFYLSLFQVCHDVPIEQNSTCGDNAQWTELKEGNNDTFVLCASFNNSRTMLSVTNIGVTCPADQPFDPSPAQFTFSQHKQNAILSWSKQNTTTAPTFPTPTTTPTSPS